LAQGVKGSVGKMFVLALLVLAESVRLAAPGQGPKRELAAVKSQLKSSFTKVAEDIDGALIQLEENKLGRRARQVNLAEIPDLSPDRLLEMVQSENLPKEERFLQKSSVRHTYRQAEHAQRLARRALFEIESQRDVASARQSLNGLKSALRHM